MTVKELIEKLQEFPEDTKVDWSASGKELYEPIQFELKADDKTLCVDFDGVEVDYDSYDEYHECPDCGKDFT